MRPEKPISYGRQFISEEDINAVVEVLRSDFLTQGPVISEFEKNFADYVGAKYAIAVCNATAALHLCALGLKVDSGSKVLTTPITFVASANCIRYCGGDVDFVDIDSNTYLMNLDLLEEKLRNSPKGLYKGIVSVDFAGYPVDMERLKKITEQYGLWIIQDACHAPGGYFVDIENNLQLCGNSSFADLSVFSFHPVKHIASGEGGMITTNNKVLYEILSLLRTHGITKNPDMLEQNHGGWYYEMQHLGYNYRLTDFQAALGNSQLKRAKESVEKRQLIAERYNSAFKGANIKIPIVKENFYHAYHLYIIQVENRKGLYDYLRENNVFAQVLYIPVHTMPYYKSLGFMEGDFPVSEAFYEHCLALPMYPTLTEEDQDWVIEKVLEFINQ